MKNCSDQTKIFPRGRNDQLITQKVDKEMLVYDLKIDKAICLNQMAFFVWQQCDGKSSIAEMAGTLEKKVKNGAGEDIVLLALKELDKANLLDRESFNFDEEIKVSRRKLIGYGVPMTVLPVIMSLVAPAAASNHSCIPEGQPCIQGGTRCCGNRICNTSTGTCTRIGR